MGKTRSRVKKLVEVRVGSFTTGEKGVVYCMTHAKCKALAGLLDCCYYIWRAR